MARTLGLSGDETAVSPFPRPASGIAENVTVVTSEEIARLNAHTVADVLQAVPGVQVDILQTPGGIVLYNVLGATQRHLLVQLDGVPLNYLSADNLAHIGSIPVQMVERIEIVKGAASAAWGSALGGVINIITKMPTRERSAGGMLSASTGSKGTNDLRAELSGTQNRFGYYLAGNALRSRGLVQGTEVDAAEGFGKLAYELPNGARGVLAVESRQDVAGLQESTRYGFFQNGTVRNLNGYLSLQYPVAERLGIELNARGGTRDALDKRGSLAQRQLFFDASVREAYRGGGASFNWGDARNALKGGVEYEHVGIREREPISADPRANNDLALERRSAYLNGTFSFGRLSILPGVRVETINLLEDPVCYTLGATFRLTENTLLRGYAAHGYSLPLITTFGSENGEVQRELQQVRTLQVGMESSAVPYLWLKGTLFYNDVWDIQSMNYRTGIIEEVEQVREGVDLELKTSPIRGFSLTGSYTFVNARDKRTNQKLDGSESGPRHAAKGGLVYEDGDLGLTCTLLADYTEWRLAAPGAKSVATIWDLHVNKKLFPRSENSPELFFSVRNIFDDKLYQYDFRPNAPRWIEGGGRLRF